jgi:DNA-binding transcriptional MerR regulator
VAWNCINCESANDYSRTACEVCGYERYFSVSEVNELLQTQQDSPDEFKKIQTNFKRASTDNKKLRQEKKDLVKKMQDLQHFYDNHAALTQQLEEAVNQYQKMNLRLKIWLAMGAIALLFFILAKVSISISF